MSIPVIIFLSVVGVAVISFCVAVLVAIIRTRRLAKTPVAPAPPFKCPSCGSEEIEVYRSGLWDGEDSAGRSTGGTLSTGTCKQCGTHARYMSSWDPDRKDSTYTISKLTDEEWQREIAPHEKWKRERDAWPFIAGDQNSAA